jgi:hypothetical protein
MQCKDQERWRMADVMQRLGIIITIVIILFMVFALHQPSQLLLLFGHDIFCDLCIASGQSQWRFHDSVSNISIF